IDADATGTAEVGKAEMGLTRVTCICDPTIVMEKRASSKTKCLKNHAFDEMKGQCEWKLAKNICGEITNNQGQTMLLEIPNWPLNKRYDVHLYNAGLGAFNKKVSSVLVRQHCFATLYKNTELYNGMTLATSGYGIHRVPE
ncbi:hypothetical protein PFISCL1PPCAC_17013, partial [Pristionchus fissidentatus]